MGRASSPIRRRWWRFSKRLGCSLWFICQKKFIVENVIPWILFLEYPPLVWCVGGFTSTSIKLRFYCLSFGWSSSMLGGRLIVVAKKERALSLIIKWTFHALKSSYHLKDWAFSIFISSGLFGWGEIALSHPVLIRSNLGEICMWRISFKRNISCFTTLLRETFLLWHV